MNCLCCKANTFAELAASGRLSGIMQNRFRELFGRAPSYNEVRSWELSLPVVGDMLNRHGLSESEIMAEYRLPGCSKRADLVLCGYDALGKPNICIVELKQWQSAVTSEDEYSVKTLLNGAERTTVHPAYQAMSYAALLRSMNSAVEENVIRVSACVWLHNYYPRSDEALTDERYKPLTDCAPLFFAGEGALLAEYLTARIGFGGGEEIARLIDVGRVVPSKGLADCVSSLVGCAPALIMTDAQQTAYAAIVRCVAESTARTVITVYGGPGTGKSAVALQSFAELLKRGLNVRYAAPGTAFRAAVLEILRRSGCKTESEAVQPLIMGTGSLYNKPTMCFDAIICDEAHRLEGRGAGLYRGEGQVEDIIRTARVSVFFTDDRQRIRRTNEGTLSRIEEVAGAYSAEVIHVGLDTQFRYGGALEYPEWVDYKLGYTDLVPEISRLYRFFDLRIADTPQFVFELLRERKAEGHSVCLISGCTRGYRSITLNGKPAGLPELVLNEYGFIALPDETGCCNGIPLGCIYTVQGLEYDYAGVIIGFDLRYDAENKRLFADPGNYFDRAGKSGLDPEGPELLQYIRNIYRVLLTRGLRGCYIFCRDKALRSYMHRLEPSGSDKGILV